MTLAIDLRPDHRNIVEDILREHLPGGVQVWVFGSRAEWTTKDSSDLDLALEGDGPLDTRTVTALELAFEESLLPFNVDVVDLLRIDDGFREAVNRSRVVLMEGRTIDRHAVSSDVGQHELELRCVAQIVMGQSPPGSTYNEHRIGLPFFQGVKDFTYRSPVPRVFCSAPTRVARKGDILLSVRAPIGRVNVADRECAIGRGLSIIRAKKSSDVRYLEFVLRNLERSWRAVEGSGSVFGNATRRDLETLRVPWPARLERRAIASVLGGLDDRIELSRRMNETVEAMARALFKSWFVDFDPVRAKMEGQDTGLPPDIADVFPDRLVESELGEIPERWKPVPVYALANVVYGAPFASRLFNAEGLGRPLIRIRDLATHEPTVSTEEVHRAGYLVDPGNIVVGMDGEFRLHIWKGPSAWLNQRVCCFEPKPDIPRSFLAEALRGPLATCERGKTGTTVIHLGKADIDEFLLLHPGEPLLAAFAKTAESLLRLTLSNAGQTRSLQHTRDALLPRLVSGKVRLPSSLVSEAA